MDHKSLLRALLNKGYSQARMAQELDVKQPTISRWLTKDVKIEHENRLRIEELARENDLIQMDNEHSAPGISAGHNEIPEINVTGGLGGGGLTMVEAVANKGGMIFSKEAIRDTWKLPEWLLSRFNARSRDLAAFPVQGDSMAPTLDDGDVIFVDLRHLVPSPPGIYAMADEFGGVIVKRLEVVSRPGDDDIEISIISDNQKHARRNLMLSEIQIIGRYVGKFTT
ncbi:hypothetical protein D5400_12505 [Georhizobium profundi]|uniref:Peptidase S24/S26A/S26B/S26C domain-containing protein n=1 Tax=Georhizobium profundi TaxID=2341112 RepID=A0A3S9B4Y7_9HYPH|nr:S24 family peptidase [Georhizobium profundi]AZN71987.1 hypothetical protein D5400_12505 [Georhizobium profundi]